MDDDAPKEIDLPARGGAVIWLTRIKLLLAAPVECLDRWVHSGYATSGDGIDLFRGGSG
ncbi:MAG: hypothetical protein IT372_14900 [Polyangiaceae bacterium]|nr:hypothetical protein [Polyangiaceae bacterium]